MLRYYRLYKKFLKFADLPHYLLFHTFFSATFRTLTALLVPYFAAKIIDLVTLSDFTGALYAVAEFTVAALVYQAFRRYNHWSYSSCANYIHNSLQEKVLKKVTTLPTNYSEDLSHAEIVNTAFRDISECRTVPDNFLDSFTCLIGIAASVILLFAVDFTVGLISLVCVIIALSLFLLHMRLRDAHNETQRRHQDSLSSLYEQLLEGHKEVHAFNLKSKLTDHFENTYSSWHRAYSKKRIHQDLADSAVPLIIGTGRILIYLISIYLILHGKGSIATLVLVLGYYEKMVEDYDRTTETFYLLSKTTIAINRLARFLNYKTPHMSSFGSNNTDDIDGKIEFRNVSFSYDKHSKVKNLDFIIEPNSFTAIVGKSGSGKSTIFRLLLRFYRPAKGKILIDDKNINSYTKKIYANNVSIVTQKPFIFDMTIRENLDLIDKNREHQISACKKVGIHDDIMRLPKGYDTPLIDDGANISAGQKQLLALARTLLSKSEILLFDEVTSALNDKASQEVINVLRKLKKNHTILVITHKPELMKLADDILVIDKGRLVARGTHKQLLNNPCYNILHVK